jgi:hypothetical protein
MFTECSLNGVQHEGRRLRRQRHQEAIHPKDFLFINIYINKGLGFLVFFNCEFFVINEKYLIYFLTESIGLLGLYIYMGSINANKGTTDQQKASIESNMG